MTAASVALGCGGTNGGDPGGGPGTAPAVMVSLLVPGPDASNFYVGAYRELPSSLDLAQMIEVSHGYDARAYNGHIYVWEGDAGTYTRYAVDDRLRITEAGVVSFQNVGGTGTVMTRFLSPHRAYSFTRQELQIVVWDPTDMVILGTISGAAVTDPNYPDLDYGEPVVFGDYVAWPIQWSDFNNLRFKPEVGVVMASATSMEPAFVVGDGRCGAGWMLFVDETGDLYATGNASFGFAHFYGPDAAVFPRDCALRMKAGTLTFDTTYRRDLNTAAGSPAIYHPWHLEGHSLLAAVWDPETDPTTVSPDDYWTTPMLRKLVRIEENSSAPVPGAPKSAVWSTLDHRIDDTLYMLSTEGSAFGADGRSHLYRVTASGAELALSTTGFLWSVGRIR